MPETARLQCLRCSLAELCVPEAPQNWTFSQFGEAMLKQLDLPDHKVLCWQGDKLEQLYIVRRGALKAVVTDINGDEQIRGFYLPGELVGLDALHSGIWPSSLEVLGEADVCQISRDDLQTLMAKDPKVAARLLDIMSQHLAISLSWNGDYTAEQRIAAFLLNFYQRTIPSADAQARLYLDMSRQDLARHLRLVTETVSREFARLRKRDIIEVHRRDIIIKDMAALVQAAGPLRHLISGVVTGEDAPDSCLRG